MSGGPARDEHLWVVDEDPDTGHLVRLVGKDLGVHVGFAHSLGALAAAVRSFSPGIIVLAVDSASLDVFQVVDHLSAVPSRPKIILTDAGYGGALYEVAGAALHSGLEVVGSVEKPIRIDDLHRMIRLAMTKGS